MFKPMKKVKIRKMLFWHIQVNLRGIWNKFFFCSNLKSKIVASVDGTYASKDRMVHIWPTLKFFYLFISALKSPTYRDFMPLKSLKLKRWKISNLGTFQVASKIKNIYFLWWRQWRPVWVFKWQKLYAGR